MIFVPPWQSWALRDMSFDPRHVPGCVLFACTDTSAYPTGVVFPADVVVNGAFAADATWTKGANWTIPTPYALHAAGSTATLSQAAILVVGNTYSTRIVVSNATAGTVTVSAGTTAGTARFNGDFTESLLCAGTTTLSITPTNDFDGRVSLVQANPRNASQLTDLSGAGHHLLQATASKQPLFVASGAGGYLQSDGVNDTMQAVFAQNQPVHGFVFLRSWDAASGAWLIDGVVTSTASILQSPGRRTAMYAGGLVTGATWAGDPPMCIDWELNGASSAIGLNGGAMIVGNPGAGNPGGFTLFSTGAAAAAWSRAGVTGVALYSGTMSESNRQRIIRWGRRMSARVDVVIP